MARVKYKLRELSDFELGWVCAFLEGEACFCYKSSALVTVRQNDREPLEKLQAIIGGRISREYIRALEHITYSDKKYFIWTSHDSRSLMRLVRPFMSIRRQIQIDNALIGKKRILSVEEKLKYTPKRYRMDL